MAKQIRKNSKRKLGLRVMQTRLRRRANSIEKLAGKHQRAFFASRLDSLRNSRRDILVWLTMLVIVAAALFTQSCLNFKNYQTIAPAGGGTYAEGVIGDIVNINPLFAQTENELATSQLVYGSLLNYDSSNRLRGDIAANFAVSSDGLNYDVKLRQGITWQGTEQAVTADDVIFTTQMITDPTVASPLYSTWRNVKVEKTGNYSVRFTLRSPLASFPQALTFGILPKYQLDTITPADLREYVSEHPAVGTGPYEYLLATGNNGEKTLSFLANPQYFRGAPNIKNLYIKSYSNVDKLFTGVENGEVNGAVGLSLDNVRELTNAKTGIVTPIALDSGVYAIFNMSSTSIMSDKTVRTALRLATDRPEIIKTVALDGATPPSELNGPIALGIYASVDAIKQPNFDLNAAKSALDAAGWVLGSDGIRARGDQRLTLSLVALAGSDYEKVANQLAEQWRQIGVDVQITLADPSNIQQNYLVPRAYDVLIHQFQLGPDPDVYEYWHSSNIQPSRLNFANYKSAVADLALFNGRTALDSATREAKYKTFVETWLNDIPAIALYRPNLNYWHSSNVNLSFTAPLADELDRYRDIRNWTVDTRTVFKTP